MLKRFEVQNERAIAGLRMYWDARMHGDVHSPAQADVDPDIAETVERIHVLDDALNADAGFATRLLEQLIGEAAIDDSPVPPPLQTPREQNGAQVASRTRTSPVPAGASRAWAAISAGSVFLIVLAIAAGLFIWHNNRQPSPAIIPLRTMSTESGVIIRTLFERQVPAGTLSGDSMEWIVNVHYRLDPGEYWRDQPVSCDTPSQSAIGLVESGTLAMIATEPVEIRRADGAIQVISAGERVDLDAGDSWAYFAAPFDRNPQWNPGSVPVVVYVTNWASESPCVSKPVNSNIISDYVGSVMQFDPTRPLVFSIEQAIVMPQTVLTPEEQDRLGFVDSERDVFRTIGVEAGVLEEVWIPAQLIAAESPTRETVTRRTFVPGNAWNLQGSLTPTDGWKREFRNGSDDPMVLAIISWSYADDENIAGLEGPAGGVTVESIFEVRLPAGTIPENPANFIETMSYSLVPGKEWTEPRRPCVTDETIEIGYVQSGVLSMRLTGPIEIVRNNGERESVQSEQEAVLHAGDWWTHSFMRTETFSGKRNSGDIPVEIIETNWAFAAACNYSWDVADLYWTHATAVYDYDHPRPIEATFQRAVVPPGASLSPEEAQRLGFEPVDNDLYRTIAVESGTLEEYWIPDPLAGSESDQHEPESVRLLNPGEVWTVQGSVTPPEGWEREFRNGGDEPLVLAIVSWSYADAEEP